MGLLEKAPLFIFSKRSDGQRLSFVKENFPTISLCLEVVLFIVHIM